MCCSILWCAAVASNLLVHIRAIDPVFALHFILYSSVFQCVAVCCIVLHRVAVNLERVYLLYLPAPSISTSCSVLQCVCSVLQCVAVCCSVLQCVTVCCSVLQCVAVLATKQIEAVLEKKI